MVKSFHDADAEVVGYHPGKGRNKGVTGSLIVEASNGNRFKVSGLTDAQRRKPPKVGETITYKYKERTSSGAPRHASFVRVRRDEPAKRNPSRIVALAAQVVDSSARRDDLKRRLMR